MAYERDPSDLNTVSDNLRRREALDNKLQADPELAEGPASGGRMALFAIAIIAILGVVFYGLNNSGSGVNTAQTPPAAIPTQQNAQTNTPNNPNANPGQTTGAAPAAPQSGVPSSESNNSSGTVTNGPTSSQTGSDSK